MPRRSRRSGRLSTTSPRTSKPSLAELIAALPPERAASVFTHASWAADRTESYERLEFLGDSVLELAIAHTLYERFPDFDEGQMAKIRSHVVSRASCAVVAGELGLGERLLERHPAPESDELARLSRNRNVLAALLEAALAALYLEHGFEPIAPAIVDAFEAGSSSRSRTRSTTRPSCRRSSPAAAARVSYALLDAEGPPHDRTFTSAAVIDGEEAGVGPRRLEEGRRAEGGPRGARRAHEPRAPARVGGVRPPLGSLRRACI